jgi:RNA-dependent RNA polymerase
MDRDCLELARLHSIAVDFQKSGKPVTQGEIPKSPKERPDWSAGEIIYKHQDRFYESRRALGVLFRSVELPELRPTLPEEAERTDDGILDGLERISLDDRTALHDTISLLIQGKLRGRIDLSFDDVLARRVLIPQFEEFSRHLTWISSAFSLTGWPLAEEEIWAGTIIAKTSQPRRRNDLQANMREQSTIIADHIREDLADPDDTNEWLIRTWIAWCISCRSPRVFGAKSYGYLALGSMFEALAVIRQREESLYR